MAIDLEPYRGELLGFAWRMLRDEHEAEDCVQSAFVSAMRDGAPPDNPRAWLYRVVHNHAVNSLRKRDRRPPPPAEPAALSPHLEQREELERLLGELEDEAREILLLRYTHGMSFEEIAEVVGRPVGTVKVYAGRALTALQRKVRRTE